MPDVGGTFTLLTWGGILTGDATVTVDSWFDDNGIQFNTTWNDHSLVLTAVPEPCTIGLLVLGLVGLLALAHGRPNI